jgi:hypothetical protein
MGHFSRMPHTMKRKQGMGEAPLELYPAFPALPPAHLDLKHEVVAWN